MTRTSLHLQPPLDDGAWMSSGRCAETDPEIFFPEKGQSAETAKQVCRGCELTARCLQYALDNGEYGVWGGTTERDRLKLRAAARATTQTAA